MRRDRNTKRSPLRLDRRRFFLSREKTILGGIVTFSVSFRDGLGESQDVHTSTYHLMFSYRQYIVSGYMLHQENILISIIIHCYRPHHRTNWGFSIVFNTGRLSCFIRD
jgi:hypothetical protein